MSFSQSRNLGPISKSAAGHHPSRGLSTPPRATSGGLGGCGGSASAIRIRRACQMAAADTPEPESESSAPAPSSMLHLGPATKRRALLALQAVSFAFDQARGNFAHQADQDLALRRGLAGGETVILLTPPLETSRATSGGLGGCGGSIETSLLKRLLEGEGVRAQNDRALAGAGCAAATRSGRSTCRRTSPRYSRRRDCHFADTPSPCLLKHLTKAEVVSAERQSRQWLHPGLGGPAVRHQPAGRPALRQVTEDPQ